MNDRTVFVYTAIFGDYTTLKEPRKQTGFYPMYCFSDLDGVGPTSWHAIKRPRAFKDPRRDATYYRLSPEVALALADVTIWIDGSFQIGDMDVFVRGCLAHLPEGGMALYRHPERSNIYDEARASLETWPGKYASERLGEQVVYYRALGLPDAHDLWAGGIIVRDNRSPLVREMDQRWLYECVRWSIQGQLSLPFVLWRMGLEGKAVPVAAIPGNVYEGPEHRWAPGADR